MVMVAQHAENHGLGDFKCASCMACELRLYKALILFRKTALVAGGGRVAASRPGSQERHRRLRVPSAQSGDASHRLIPVRECPSLPIQAFLTLDCSHFAQDHSWLRRHQDVLHGMFSGPPASTR